MQRTDGFPHVADLMVNSTYWPDLEEVAAFEELVGSHGGMGGPQQYPFLLAPAAFPVPDEIMLGPGTVHRAALPLARRPRARRLSRRRACER